MCGIQTLSKTDETHLTMIKNLQFCERNDIGIRRTMPNSLLTRNIVVIETRSSGIKQLPPLIVMTLSAEIKNTVQVMSVTRTEKPSFDLSKILQ